MSSVSYSTKNERKLNDLMEENYFQWWTIYGKHFIDTLYFNSTLLSTQREKIKKIKLHSIIYYFSLYLFTLLVLCYVFLSSPRFFLLIGGGEP